MGEMADLLFDQMMRDEDCFDAREERYERLEEKKRIWPKKNPIPYNAPNEAHVEAGNCPTCGEMGKLLLVSIRDVTYASLVRKELMVRCMRCHNAAVVTL